MTGLLLDLAEGFEVLEGVELLSDDARFAAEWLLPFALCQISQEGGHDWAAAFAKELADARRLERGFRRQGSGWSFDSIATGILESAAESRYSRTLAEVSFCASHLAILSAPLDVLLRSIHGSAGRAHGLLHLLTRRLPGDEQLQPDLRVHLVRQGLEAIGKMRTSIGVLESLPRQDQDLEPWDLWSCTLEEALCEEEP